MIGTLTRETGSARLKEVVTMLHARAFFMNMMKKPGIRDESKPVQPYRGRYRSCSVTSAPPVWSGTALNG
jgi:hypothetical protein